MKTFRPRARRTLLRLLAQRRGSIRAIRDIEYLGEVFRFSVLFSVLVLVPVALLALLALRSLEAEELLVDAGLQQRADAIAGQVETGLRAMFEDFELRVAERVDQGTDLRPNTVPTPGLRAVYRFDPGDRLVDPVVLPTDEDAWVRPTAAYDRAAREAAAAEARQDHAAAAAAWSRAASMGRTSAHRGVARLGAARARLTLGDASAVEELVVIAAEHPRDRDERGVRVADLAHLLRAEALRAAGREEEAETELRNLLRRTQAAAAVVGYPADVFVGRLAMERLGDALKPGERRVAAAELERRAELLHWSGVVLDELRLVAARAEPGPGLHIQPEERALWATTRVGDQLYVFSFEYERVQRELGRRVLSVAGKVDPDLTAALVPAREDTGPYLARRTLAPELPRLAVVVRPSDPGELASQRARTRTQRRLVIALAVLAAAIGIAAAVRAVNRELDTARQKSDFAANVSHELRSPITQIRLKGEALQLGLCYDDADRQAHYDAIVREAERLSRLVDNVLDFSSIERGVKRYTLRPDDLGEVVRRAVESARGAAQAAGLALHVSVPETLPVIWIDREAIGQVMTNLLSNAMKYGSDGGSVEVVAREGPKGVEVSVTDHGIGIAPEDQDRIFEHFYRVSSAEVRKRRGTGIGLTIVRYIVEAHGGTITVESEPGRGSTFTVTLPLEPPAASGG